MITPSESFAGSDKETIGLRTSMSTSSPVTAHLNSSPLPQRQNLLPSLPSLGFLSLPVRPPQPPSPVVVQNRPPPPAQQSGFSTFTFSTGGTKSSATTTTISTTAQPGRFHTLISSAPTVAAISPTNPNVVRVISAPTDGYFRPPQMFSFNINDNQPAFSLNTAVLQPRTEAENAELKAKKPKVEKVASRTRLEWSEAEETILLQGLNAHGCDFERIHQMLPSRSRTQIRTHYRYLAHSLSQNQQAEAQSLLNLGTGDGKPVKMRRLRVRGRPPVGGKGAALSNITMQLLRTVEQIERQRVFAAKSAVSLPKSGKVSPTPASVASVPSSSSASSNGILSSASSTSASAASGLAQLTSSVSDSEEESSTDSGADLPPVRSPPQLSALIPNRAALPADDDHSGFGALTAAAAALGSLAAVSRGDNN